ncbi:uncharacterized protein LOC110978853 [Acanthaster planci]|uniref:Uncharacterized protein LOC110978853 n=1 Tax=Acanthaster planci TaxID=133434 RepID=A0A8B7Y9C7_ACAPL|nr:uncharacterized protein LOC110978853 [Acanthaster planci]
MDKYTTFEEYQQLWQKRDLLNLPDEEYQGINLYHCMSENTERLKTWTTREDDIWIVTFVKAGTTWVQEIVSCIMHDGDLGAVNNKHTTFRVLFIEHDFPQQLRRLKNLPDTLQIAEETPSPRILKSHLPGQLLPPQIWEKKPKIVYVLRNPKDVVVSFFYFSKLCRNDPKVLNKTFDEFFQEMLEGTNHYGPWWDHYLYFWKRRHDENILVLRFEDIKRDLRGTVENISQFLDKKLSNETIDAITEHCTFRNMKKNKMAQLDSLFDKKDLPEGSSFMRKGKVGDWKSHFTVAQNEAMDALIRDKLHGTGLTFDFDHVVSAYSRQQHSTGTMEKYVTFEEYQQLWQKSNLMNLPDEEFEGIKLYQSMAKNVEGLKTWTVREDDIWVVTFMKTGTTWVQEIVSCIMHDGDLDTVNNKHTTFRVLFIEHDFSEQLRLLKKLPDSLQIAGETPSPRLLKSHLPGQLLPPQIWEKKPKIVYVLRNPKDVSVSFFHFSKLCRNDPKVLNKTFDEFFQEMLKGTNHYGPWWDHYLYFWNRRHDENILVLRFEDIKRDLRGTVETVCRFLGKKLSDETINIITEHCTFSNMKRNKMAQLDSLFDKKDLPEGSSFMRKGKVGDWKSHFTVAQNEAMDALIQDKLHGTGLKFDYE